MKRHALRWEGEIIGYIAALRYDMPWHYGRWISIAHPREAELFALVPDLDKVGEDEPTPYNDQSVELQGPDGCWIRMLLITRPSDGQIELRSVWD